MNEIGSQVRQLSVVESVELISTQPVMVVHPKLTGLPFEQTLHDVGD
jgi:hypothetical protein